MRTATLTPSKEERGLTGALLPRLKSGVSALGFDHDSSALDKMYASKLHKCSGLYDLVVLTKTLASDKSPVKDFIRRVEKELWTMLLIKKLHDKVAIVDGSEAERVQAALKAVDMFANRKLVSRAQIITA